MSPIYESPMPSTCPQRSAMQSIEAFTPDQLDTLRHMLGINDPSVGTPRCWRNYAAVEPGDPTFVELARLGAVRLAQKATPQRAYDFYECTEGGRVAALASHRDIRWSKPKRVYGRFLQIKDALNDLTFKQFLTDPAFAAARSEA